MPSYDAARFDPPAPLAYVNLRNPDSGAVRAEVPMLLDTGADVTLVPAEIVRQLAASVLPDVGYELAGFDGSLSVVSAVRLELVFCRRRFRGQFLVTDQTWGILGRNILNAIPLLLDGPGLVWEELRRG